MKHATENRVQSYLEMYDSLHKAIDEAGGSGTDFLATNLKEMTVTELIQNLATWNIRFCYLPVMKDRK